MNRMLMQAVMTGSGVAGVEERKDGGKRSYNERAKILESRRRKIYNEILEMENRHMRKVLKWEKQEEEFTKKIEMTQQEYLESLESKRFKPESDGGNDDDMNMSGNGTFATAEYHAY